MARYRSSMKMGALNLLILVIALSLAVLSVLTLVTAHANETLADMQADAATETYAEEIAGQTFLASLDKKLAPSKAAGTVATGLNSALRLSVQDIADEACDKAMEAAPEVELTSEAKLLSIKELYVNMKVSFSLRNDLDDRYAGSTRSSADLRKDAEDEDVQGGASEEIIEDDAMGTGGSSRTTQDVDILEESLEGTSGIDSDRYYMSVAHMLEDCVGGISLNVSTSTGRDLSVLIGIEADGNHVILSWKNSKIWYGDEKKETLWMG